MTSSEMFGPRNDSEKETFAIEAFRVDVQYTLQKVMKAKGVTLSELARRMGVKRWSAAKIFDADSDLTVREVAKIFFALGHECSLTSGPAPREKERDEQP